MSVPTSIPWRSAEDLRDYLLRSHDGRGQTDSLLSGLALFGAGLLVGAGLALLLAPASGEEVRQEIGRRVGDLQERLVGDPEGEPADGHSV